MVPSRRLHGLTRASRPSEQFEISTPHVNKLNLDDLAAVAWQELQGCVFATGTIKDFESELVRKKR